MFTGDCGFINAAETKLKFVKSIKIMTIISIVRLQVRIVGSVLKIVFCLL